MLTGDDTMSRTNFSNFTTRAGASAAVTYFDGVPYYLCSKGVINDPNPCDTLLGHQRGFCFGSPPVGTRGAFNGINETTGFCACGPVSSVGWTENC